MLLLTAACCAVVCWALLGLLVVGLIIINAHYVSETSGEGFAVRLFRQGPTPGFDPNAPAGNTTVSCVAVHTQVSRVSCTDKSWQTRCCRGRLVTLSASDWARTVCGPCRLRSVPSAYSAVHNNTTRISLQHEFKAGSIMHLLLWRRASCAPSATTPTRLLLASTA